MTSIATTICQQYAAVINAAPIAQLERIQVAPLILIVSTIQLKALSPVARARNNAYHHLAHHHQVLLPPLALDQALALVL